MVAGYWSHWHNLQSSKNRTSYIGSTFWVPSLGFSVSMSTAAKGPKRAKFMAVFIQTGDHVCGLQREGERRKVLPWEFHSSTMRSTSGLFFRVRDIFHKSFAARLGFYTLPGSLMMPTFIPDQILIIPASLSDITYIRLHSMDIAAGSKECRRKSLNEMPLE